MATTCHYHPDRPIHGVCAGCGRPACDQCLVELNSGPHCKACLEARVKGPDRPVSGLWRFVTSLVPGAGHMYMGLMNRGLQLMVLAVLGGTVLIPLLPPVGGLFIAGTVFFSIFDSREAYLRMKQGHQVPDVLIANWEIFDNKRWIGYGLVFAGAVSAYRALVQELGGMLATYSPNFWRIQRAFEGATVGIIAVVAGLWLLKRTAPAGTGSRGGEGDHA